MNKYTAIRNARREAGRCIIHGCQNAPGLNPKTGKPYERCLPCRSILAMKRQHKRAA